MTDNSTLNRFGGKRISSRQVDELIGLARGVCADGAINQKEAEFLETWLAANSSVSGEPLLADLYSRVSDMLADGEFDEAERKELFETLVSLSGDPIELGETLKSSRLPLCDPEPELAFKGFRYCFTGTFSFGKRAVCEAAAMKQGALIGSLTKQTNVLVVGQYATESWKHSSMGNKILKAAEMRDKGLRIYIVSEAHWRKALEG